MAPAGPQTLQPRLFAFSMGERDADTHVVSGSNKAAADLVMGWRRWPGGAALLTGPSGSGRSHLGQVWARAAGAGAYERGVPAHEAFARFEGRLLVDDADRGQDEESLIRLFDLARERGGAVLFIAEEREAPWRPALADLASRLAAAPRARLFEPDPALLAVVLRRSCRDRYLELSDEAVDWITTRMERSFAGVKRWTEALDRGVRRGARKPITVAQARRVLSDMETLFRDDPGLSGEKPGGEDAGS